MHRQVILVPGVAGDPSIFTNTIKELRARGFADTDIVVIRQPQKKGCHANQYMSEERLRYVRERFEEMSAKAGNNGFDVIAASMGTLDSMAAMQGGLHFDTKQLDLGEPLSSVGTYISICGVYGGYPSSLNPWMQALCHTMGWKALSGKSGFQPGSEFLRRLESRRIPAQRLAVFVSLMDDVLGPWAPITGLLPGALTKYYWLDHRKIIENTARDQVDLLLKTKW